MNMLRTRSPRVEHLAMYRRVLASVGLAAVGLAPLAVAGCGDDTASGGAGGEAAATTGATTGGSTSKGAGSGASQSGSATSGSATSGAATTTSVTGAASSSAAGMAGVERCFPSDPASCPGIGDAPGLFGTCTDVGEMITAWVSGPTPGNMACCYVVDVGAPGDPSCGGIGRPLLVGDRPIAARTVARAEWATAVDPGVVAPWRARPVASVSRDGLDETACLAIAGGWANDAAYEHASVASFAKLAIELVGLGAPPDLVEAAQVAGIDEIRHARLCYALASAYHGVEVGPSTLPEATDVRFATSLGDLADAAVREGCYGETLASLVAREQLAGATDPGVRAALETIAEDEARHAELAFRIVDWAIRVGGAEVAERVRVASQEALANLTREAFAVLAREQGEEQRGGERTEDAVQGSCEAKVLAAHGRISARAAMDVRLAGARAVVEPALTVLLMT